MEIGRREAVWLEVHDYEGHEAYGRARPDTRPLRAPARFGRLVVNFRARAALVDGRQIELTAREWAILAYLAANRDTIMPYEDILVAAFGPDWVTSQGVATLRTNMARLRDSLGPCGDAIVTRKWVGYGIGNLPGAGLTRKRPIVARPRWSTGLYGATWRLGPRQRALLGYLKSRVGKPIRYDRLTIVAYGTEGSMKTCRQSLVSLARLGTAQLDVGLLAGGRGTATLTEPLSAEILALL